MGPDQEGYKPTEAEMASAEESMTPEQKKLSEEREYRANSHERQKAARERIKPIEDLLKYFGVKVNGRYGIDMERMNKDERNEMEKSNAKLVGLIAKALGGVSYATIAERAGAFGEGTVLFQLWNEEPWLGLDKHKLRVDRGENGSDLCTALADEKEAYKVLEQLNVVGVPSKAAAEFPELEGRTPEAEGSSHYGGTIRYESVKGGVYEQNLPLVFKVDTTPESEKTG